MTTTEDNTSNLNDEEKKAKIAELQDIIATAEETILSAKRLLANLQPEIAQPTMPIHKTEDNDDIDGQVIYGFFDGQIMIGDDGKQYPVPANYASKSKLVEGDKLKLTITSDNKFVYKQIGPIQRNYLIGLVEKDERGNFFVQTQEKKYKVLLAAATYFKIEPGDEVTLIVPQNGDTVWGAIENVLQKGSAQINTDTALSGSQIVEEFSAGNNTNHSDLNNQDLTESANNDTQSNDESGNTKMSALERLEKEVEKERQMQSIANSKNNSANPVNSEEKIAESESASTDDANDWKPSMEELYQEADVPITSNN